ncbi:MAG: hypothetical protein EBR67_06745 [Proteobacteria bacterium]|nr:hypothetical protein [Pseudomonadota bacterium]
MTTKTQKTGNVGTARKRAISRLRRTNDRSVLGVHEDHEDDENAEIGVCGQSDDKKKLPPERWE